MVARRASSKCILEVHRTRKKHSFRLCRTIDQITFWDARSREGIHVQVSNRALTRETIIPNRNINFRGNFTHTGYSKSVVAVEATFSNTVSIVWALCADGWNYQPPKARNFSGYRVWTVSLRKVLLYQPVQLPSMILLWSTVFSTIRVTSILSRGVLFVDSRFPFDKRARYDEFSR